MKLQINWNALGVSAAVACAIHCALLPLFISTLPLFGINILDNIYFEAGMMLTAFFDRGLYIVTRISKTSSSSCAVISFYRGDIAVGHQAFFYRLYSLAGDPFINTYHKCVLS